MVGQWYSWTTMKKWWDVWLSGDRTRGPAHHQEGGVDSLFVPPQESKWTHQDSCGQKGNN